jgi:hypothetical protein
MRKIWYSPFFREELKTSENWTTDVSEETNDTAA